MLSAYGGISLEPPSPYCIQIDLVANLSVRPSAQGGNITCLAGAVVDLEMAHGRLRLYVFAVGM